jgi:hypothetical protein
MRTIVVAALGVLLAESALACSFTPGYEPFRIEAVVRRPTPAPAAAPAIEVERIERGYDDGDGASCSDAGIFVFRVPSDVLGYRFEIVAGGDDGHVFPDGFVRTREPGRLRFVWLDGESNWQESIDLLVKVTAISSLGVVSEPALLRIRHSGGATGRR